MDHLKNSNPNPLWIILSFTGRNRKTTAHAQLPPDIRWHSFVAPTLLFAIYTWPQFSSVSAVAPVLIMQLCD